MPFNETATVDVSEWRGDSLIVGVVGAGTMGAGIAQVCLQAGHEVQLHDVDHAAIERGRDRIADGWPAGREGPADARRPRSDAGLASTTRTRWRAWPQEADLVIEAALEDLELKRTIFRALGAAARPATILPRTPAR